MNKVYRVYCNGFVKCFLTLAETQAHIDELRGKGCVGKEVVISIGRGDLRTVVFAPGHPERREILKAAA